MTISVDQTIKRIIWLLTVLLFFTFVAFNEPAWGKYVVLLGCFLIAMLTIVLEYGRIKLRIEAYHIFLFLFALYSLASSMWAIRAADATEKAWTLFQMLLCTTMVYLHYQEEDNVHALLTAVIWAGYLLALYTIAIYGVEYIVNAAIGRRISQSYNNANTIGMTVAVSCFLQVNEIFCKRTKWTAILMIPAVLVIAATQSRKALLMLGVGVFALYCIKSFQKKGNLNRILKFCLTMVIFAVAIYLLLQLSIFSGILKRMDSMLSAFFEGNTKDMSTNERMIMIRIGREIFRGAPILGIGMGNAHIVVAQNMGLDTYLHNNFLEVVSGGGIMGFCLYYGMYVYLLVNLLKYRNEDKEYFAIGLTWAVVMLVMDYGLVSYYLKYQWFYLMIHFLNVRCLRQKYWRKSNAGKEAD